jgi:hypothetical protein
MSGVGVVLLLFIFRTLFFIFSHFLFVYFLSFCFILFLTAINL